MQNVKCKSLFITHYPEVALDLERRFPKEVENIHMSYAEETRIDGSREVTFLYKLIPSMATESFGIECGRLARLPEKILEAATKRAEVMRSLIDERARKNRYVLRLYSPCEFWPLSPML